MLTAIDPKYDSMGDFELVDELNRLSGVDIPKAIEDTRTAPVLHDSESEVNEMCDNVKRILGIN